ncbi:rna-directed dna polymerase from mobile element jockey-like [Pitangus sulphuratus]|nr:rna-directed dna polymerase from mobile element jockey-like [Pitangus sulphuratus]
MAAYGGGVHTEVAPTYLRETGPDVHNEDLVIVGDFNLPDVRWKFNIAEKMQSIKILKHGKDNFLTQMVSEPTRGSALLDLLFTNKEGLVAYVVVRGHLGHSDHEIIEFSVLVKEVPDYWRLASVTPIHREGQKEDLGKYRLVDLTSVPGKVMEQIILGSITRYVEDNQGNRSSQHGFVKARSCLSNHLHL